MNARLSDGRSRREVEPRTVLDLLAQSETPALATDGDGHVVFWNHAAERVFGRTSNQVLGRRCFDMIGGRDVFGNRFCHGNCAVLAMARKGESVRPFEMAVEVHSKLEAAALAFRQGWVTGADRGGDRGAGPGDRLRGAREGL